MERVAKTGYFELRFNHQDKALRKFIFSLLKCEIFGVNFLIFLKVPNNPFSEQNI